MRKQWFRNLTTDNLENQCYFMEDWEEYVTYLENEFNFDREVILKKGVVSGGNISSSDNLILKIDETLIFLNKEYIEIDLDTVLLDLNTDTLSDNTYNVYIDLDYDFPYREESRDQYKPPTEKRHYSKIPIHSVIIDTASHSDKVLLGTITTVSNVITVIDASGKEIATNIYIDDTQQSLDTTWSSQNISNVITQRILQIDEDPIIAIQNTPPVSPNDYDRYIVGSSPTGVWVGYTNYITQWNDDLNDWIMIEPEEGTTIFNQSTNYYMHYDGVNWVRKESKLDINELSGTLNKNKLSDDALYSLNPIGTIIAIDPRVKTVYRPNATYWKLCDGTGSLPSGFFDSTPDLSIPTLNDSRFLMGGSSYTQSTGNNTLTLSTTHLPSHTHSMSHTHDMQNHSHSGTSNFDGAHTHPIRGSFWTTTGTTYSYGFAAKECNSFDNGGGIGITSDRIYADSSTYAGGFPGLDTAEPRHAHAFTSGAPSNNTTGSSSISDTGSTGTGTSFGLFDSSNGLKYFQCLYYIKIA